MAQANQPNDLEHLFGKDPRFVFPSKKSENLQKDIENFLEVQYRHLKVEYEDLTLLLF